MNLNLSTSRHPIDHRVDDDELGAFLHAIGNPETLEAVGVGLKGIRAPDKDGTWAIEIGVIHHLLVKLAHVGNREAR